MGQKPTTLEWHEAPELPAWEGGEVSFLTYHEPSATYEVATINYQPDRGFLIGVSHWARIN